MPEVVAPETQAREALITMLRTTFAGDQFPVKDDKLHASLGDSGTIIGVYPERTTASSRDNYVNEYELVVQFYGSYTLEVNREQNVSPSIIERQAERFRQAIRSGVDPRTGAVWYFNVTRISYPDDPTGNKTRFEATILARGNNSALIETSG
jgi:hypothetical protein